MAEGGFLDIDVKMTGPDGRIIYSGERETDSKYTFSAHATGRYTCAIFLCLVRIVGSR